MHSIGLHVRCRAAEGTWARLGSTLVCFMSKVTCLLLALEHATHLRAAL